MKIVCLKSQRKIKFLDRSGHEKTVLVTDGFYFKTVCESVTTQSFFSRLWQRMSIIVVVISLNM